MHAHPFLLRYLCVCITVHVQYSSELTGHQRHCGNWKWCSGGEMPGGRLGINSRICDALWSTHLREKRDGGEGERASDERTKWRRRKVFKPFYRAESITDQTSGHLQMQSSLILEDWGLPGILLALRTSTVRTQNPKKAKRLICKNIAEVKLMSKMFRRTQLRFCNMDE